MREMIAIRPKVGEYRNCALLKMLLKFSKLSAEEQAYEKVTMLFNGCDLYTVRAKDYGLVMDLIERIFFEETVYDD